MKKFVTGDYRSYSNLIHDIHFHINANLTPILQQVAEDIKKMLHDYVNTYWYGAHSPTNYQRTFEFINSLTVDNVQTTGDRKEVFIYFDPAKIGAYQTELGQWNQHLDVYGIESAAEAIALWIEEGQDSPLYSYDGIHQIEQTELALRQNNKLAKDIGALLTAKGYTCKIR
jgi:hypothetical protein